MLSPQLVLQIATSLVAKGYLDITTPPEELIQVFEYYTKYNITSIIHDIQQSREHVELFFNETLPCMKNVTQEAVYDSKLEDTVYVLNLFWDRCFKSVVPNPRLEEAKKRCPRDLPEKFDSLVFGVMLVIGWFFTIVFSFVRKRNKCCTGCCWGRPGPVVPLNMLDTYENRLGFSAAFGITAFECFAVTFQSYGMVLSPETAHLIKRHVPSYLSIFIKLWITILLSTITYPMFVVQGMRNKLIGSIMGIMMSGPWLMLIIWKNASVINVCKERWELEKVRHLTWLIILPGLAQILCLVFLTYKFTLILVKTIRKRMKNKEGGSMIIADDTNWRKEHLYLYVHKVINKKNEDHHKSHGSYEEITQRIWPSYSSIPRTVVYERDLTIKEKILAKVNSLMYHSNADFKYSTRMIISTCVAGLVVYCITTYLILWGYIIFVVSWDEIFQHEMIVAISNWLKVTIEDVKDYVGAIAAAFWLGLALSIILYTFSTVNSFTWYRKHVVMLRKGDRSFLPNSINKGSADPPGLMAASVKFAGYQVGYAIWGFVISGCILFILSAVIITQLYLPMKRKKLSLLLILFIKIWPSLLVTIAILILQKLMARFFCLIDKDTLAVDNRRAFHILSYFMFYFNIFIGMVSCLLRILFGLIFGIVFLSRLQKSSLPRSYERRDPGYLAYLGYLMLEHQHANPILQVFVKLLVEIQDIKNKNKRCKVIAPFEEQFHMMSKNNMKCEKIEQTDEEWAQRNEMFRKTRLRNKWHLYKIMVLNPSLKKFRCKPKKITGRLSSTLLGIGKMDISFSSPQIDKKQIDSDNDTTELKLVIESDSQNSSYSPDLKTIMESDSETSLQNSDNHDNDFKKVIKEDPDLKAVTDSETENQNLDSNDPGLKMETNSDSETEHQNATHQNGLNDFSYVEL